MADRYRRRNRRTPRFQSRLDVVAALAILVLTGFVFISSFVAGEEQAHAGLTMPASDNGARYLRYENPMALIDARMTTIGLVESAVARGQAAIPEVPWGDHGLSGVSVDLSEIRWDDGRERYVQTLADGRVAVLTLDGPTQRRLEGVVARYTEPGEAAVAIEPSTGRVLALVSDGADERYGDALALRASTWAASTFKVITGASLLQHRMANPETTTCYHGGGSGITADLLDDNAELDTLCLSLRRAMALSANVVFGKLALRHLSRARLQHTAEQFGYNRRIPFELGVERSSAEVPDSPLEFARMAAGFRHTRQSPLHAALIQAAVANDGTLMVPTLVERIESPGGETLWEHEPVVWDEILTPVQAAALRNLESETCVNGTARRQFQQRNGWPAAIRAWGKTGTLSNAAIDGTQPTPAYIYSWFSGFAEHGERSIAVAGLVVQAPSWQIKGAYLASEAVLGYLHGR